MDDLIQSKATGDFYQKQTTTTNQKTYISKGQGHQPASTGDTGTVNNKGQGTSLRYMEKILDHAVQTTRTQGNSLRDMETILDHKHRETQSARSRKILDHRETQEPTSARDKGLGLQSLLV